MAFCFKNVSPAMFLFIVVFIIPIDLIRPAAVINNSAGARPDVYPTDGAPNAHPPKEESSSSSGEEAADIASDAGKLPEEESCLNCEHHRSVEEVRNTLGEKALVEKRLDLIKHQILEKLRMTARPTIRFPRAKLPAQLLHAQSEIMQNDYPHPSAEYSGRFSGEQKQIIIFGKQVRNCTAKRRSACLVFDMPRDVEADDVTAAELWLHKRRSDGRGMRRLVVADVSRDVSRHGKTAVATTLHERQVTNKRGWVKFSMRGVVRHWMRSSRRASGVVQVWCKSCRKERHHRGHSIEINGENHPIIVLNIADRRERNKRSADNCGTGCCMENFYVNFTAIGWDDWIIVPKGYAANHCTGSCSAVGRSNVRPEKSHGPVLLAVHALGDRSISACCAPSRMSPISMIYYDEQGLIINRNVPNMVVDECKCFF